MKNNILYLAPLALAGLAVSIPLNAATAFSDDFESPVIDNPTGYDLANTSQQIDTNKWVRSTENYAAGRNGLVHEDENGGNTFTDSTGSQAWAGRYDTNTGLTSAFNQIGAITAGQTITVTFDAVLDGYVSNLTPGVDNTNSNITNGTDLDAYLVLFNGAGTRNDVSNKSDGNQTGTSAVLASLTGAQGVNDTYQTFSFSYTVGDAVLDNNGGVAGGGTNWDSALLGDDIAVRFGKQNHSIIDNVEVSIIDNVEDSIPEPSSFALLAGCFGLAWVMIRRRA